MDQNWAELSRLATFRHVATIDDDDSFAQGWEENLSYGPADSPSNANQLEYNPQRDTMYINSQPALQNEPVRTPPSVSRKRVKEECSIFDHVTEIQDHHSKRVKLEPFDGADDPPKRNAAQTRLSTIILSGFSWSEGYIAEQVRS